VQADQPSDKDRLQGTWVADSAEFAGRPLSADHAKKTILVFAGGQIRFTMPDGKIERGIFKLDSAVTPKEIDVIDETEQKGLLGIYRFDGDQLVVCMGQDRVRPKEFKSQPGVSSLLLVLRRVATDRDWVSLFNGTDLSGWRTLDSPEIWRVKDGKILGGGNKGYLFTEREYENFHFRVEAKFVGNIDSGQVFRWKPGLHQGYEAQIGGDTGTLQRHQLPQPAWLFRNRDNSVPADTWFTQEVIANGSRLIVKLNGATLVDIVDDKYRIGHLALQSFNKEGTVYFRKIEIKELPSEYTNGQTAAGWGAVVDPIQNCKFATIKDELAITVPSGHRNLNPLVGFKNITAPRVLQNVQGDFDIQVQVLPFPRPKPNTSSNGKNSYVGAGLLVWQDDSNFVRFMRGANGESGRLIAAVEVYGNGRRLTSAEVDLNDEPLLLRIERIKGRFQYRFSYDGVKWNYPLDQLEVHFADHLQVGVAAVNSTVAEHVARFRKLEIKELLPDPKK
jgi:uncharacterized protein (TIGR03067 family)